MDLNQIAVFARVAETGSFSAAARLLGLPKSTVSRRVAHLEDELGVRLLQRSTRRVSLTEAGARYYGQVAGAIEALGAASTDVSELSDSPSGVLRITAPVDVGSDVLAAALSRFVRRYPSLRVDVELTGRTVDLIGEGFDLAVRAGRLRDSTLVARKLFEIEHQLFASPDYLAERGTPNRPQDLKRHECVLFRPRDGKCSWRLEGPRGATTVEVGGALGCDDFVYLRRAVLAGAGIGLIPSFACGEALRTGRLVRVLPRYRFRPGAVSIIYPSARHLPRKVAVLRDFLLQELSALSAAGADA